MIAPMADRIKWHQRPEDLMEIHRLGKEIECKNRKISQLEREIEVLKTGNPE